MDNSVNKSYLLKLIRMAICDNDKPYINTDESLLAVAEISIGLYSKINPIARKSKLHTVVGKTQYSLPSDFQTWLDGFEDFEVIENNVYLNFEPTNEYDIEYLYLADRTISDIPSREFAMLVDYVYYFIIDSSLNQNPDISGLKIGDGLHLQFANTSDLRQSAQLRYQQFIDRLYCIQGSWF